MPNPENCMRAQEERYGGRNGTNALCPTTVGRGFCSFRDRSARLFTAAGYLTIDFCQIRTGLKRSFCYFGEFVPKKRQSIRLHAAGARCLVHESRNLLFPESVRTQRSNA